MKDSDKPYHARSMSWAQRLKRVFNIDISTCDAFYSNNVNEIACITEPDITAKILKHFDKNGSFITANTCKAPPRNESI
jgi:hypothetical protein